MAAWSNPGSGRAVTTSSAQRSPWASEIATRTGAGRTAAASTRRSCSSTDRTVGSAVQPSGQPFAQVGTVLRVLQREVDEGADVAARVAQVVAAAAVHDDVDRVALGDQQ